MTPRITTIGSTSLDLLWYTFDGLVLRTKNDLLRKQLVAFERSAKITCEDAFFCEGGSASNTGTTFARFGIPCQILTAVGDDSIGSDRIRHFMEERISRRFVQIVSGAYSNMSLIINTLPQRDHVLFVHRGASDHLNCSSTVMSQIRSPWLYLASLSGRWQSKIDRIFSSSSKRGQKIAWNPGVHQLRAPARLLRSLIRKTEIFILNLDEALELLTRLGTRSPNQNPRDVTRRLHVLGARITIVTNGHKGAYVMNGTNLLYHAARIGKTINKTGAGDAFGSGFLGALLLCGEVRKALRVAIYNSSSVVQHIGAQTGILHAGTVRKLIKSR